MKKPIPGFPGYFADADGNIYGSKGRRMPGTIGSRGYRLVSVKNDDGRRRTMRVHRLVCLAFGVIGEKNMVNHIDGNKLNNCLSNLELTDHRENLRHAFKIGLRSNRGDNHPGHILKADDLPKIRYLIDECGLDFSQVSRAWGVNQITISNAYKGKSWKDAKVEEWE